MVVIENALYEGSTEKLATSFTCIFYCCNSIQVNNVFSCEARSAGLLANKRLEGIHCQVGVFQAAWVNKAWRFMKSPHCRMLTCSLPCPPVFLPPRGVPNSIGDLVQHRFGPRATTESKIISKTRISHVVYGDKSGLCWRRNFEREFRAPKNYCNNLVPKAKQLLFKRKPRRKQRHWFLELLYLWYSGVWDCFRLF